MGHPVIYILTNKTNGKGYVGLARKSFESRLKSHFKNDSYIGKALRKYGLDGFEIQQIAYAKEELNYWEKYFIERLDARHPWGYNLTDGGDGLVNPSQVVRDQIKEKMKQLPRNPDFTFAGHHHTDESKGKTSESLKITMAQPEVKARMIASAKLKPPPSEGMRRKNREAHLGVPRSDAHLFSERTLAYTRAPGYVNPMKDKKRPDLAERNREGKGRKMSKETRDKQMVSQQSRRQRERELLAA